MLKVAIVGKACSGKTSVLEVIHERVQSIDLIKFADPIYDVLKTLGVEKDRLFMQEYSDLAKKHFGDDVFVKSFKVRHDRLAFTHVNAVVCDDVRYPEELEMVKSLGFQVIYLDCDDNVRKSRHDSLGLVFNDNHSSENQVDMMCNDCDYLIDNTKLSYEGLGVIVNYIVEDMEL